MPEGFAAGAVKGKETSLHIGVIEFSYLLRYHSQGKNQHTYWSKKILRVTISSFMSGFVYVVSVYVVAKLSL